MMVQTQTTSRYRTTTLKTSK